MRRNSILRTILVSIGLWGMTTISAQEFPTFTEVTPSGTPMVFRGTPLWGDYDNDGKMEALVLGRMTDGWHVKDFILRPDGDNLLRTDGFETIGFPRFDQGVDSEVYNPILAWIDYNNDGLMDLLFMGNLFDQKVKDENDQLADPKDKKLNPDQSDAANVVFFHLYKNTGAGFERVEDSGLEGLYVEEESNYASVISVADYDKDGYLDFVVTGRRAGTRHVDLYKNDAGTGKFVLQGKPLVKGGEATAFTAMNAGSVSFADFNNDGWPDIIVNGWNTQRSNAVVMMYINNQDGTFFDNDIDYSVNRPASKGQIGIADINGDGKLDFVITGEYMESKDVWVKTTDFYFHQLTNPDGTVDYRFVNGLELGVDQMQRSSMDFADLNGDGLLDIVMAGEVGSGIPRTSIYVQDDKGEFWQENNKVGTGRSGAVITLADYNNDGHLDCMTMGYSNFVDRNNLHFGVFRNNGNLTANTRPTAPTNLAKSYDANTGTMTFTWDAGADAETPAAALRYNFYVKKPNGEIFRLLPADVNTGFLKSAIHTTALLSTSYSMKIEDGDHEWGVQTIDLAKSGSVFTKMNATGIAGTTSHSSVSVYAFDGQIMIESDQAATITVIDAAGKQIITLTDVTKASVPHLGSGVYMVKVQVAGAVEVVKVVL